MPIIFQYFHRNLIIYAIDFFIFSHKNFIIIVYTSAVFKSHQAGKVTSSPWYGGDTEKSYQVVENYIREEELLWYSLLHLYLEM